MGVPKQNLLKKARVAQLGVGGGKGDWVPRTNKQADNQKTLEVVSEVATNEFTTDSQPVHTALDVLLK